MTLILIISKNDADDDDDNDKPSFLAKMLRDGTYILYINTYVYIISI